MRSARTSMSMQQHTPKQLEEIVTSFASLRIGVVGDVMLDEYEYGFIERMSPEAPVPVIRMESRVSMPGGAGNVATNIAAYGAMVDICSVVGNDTAATELRALLEKGVVNTSGLLTTSRITTLKKRIVAKGEHVVRVDYEMQSNISLEQEAMLRSSIANGIASWDAVVIADYAKGCITPELVKSIIVLAAQRNIPVIVDTKPQNLEYFKDVALLTPNAKEVREMTDYEDITTAGKELQAHTHSPVLVTQGENGMTLFTENHSIHCPSFATSVIDVSGAGDTVVATASLALASRVLYEEMVRLASIAAAVAVEKPGTATITTKELIERIYAENT